jgi:hypothetical protein
MPSRLCSGELAHAQRAKLFQKIGSHLPAGQFPTLIFDPRDLRVRKQLGIELDALHIDADNGRPALIAPGPGKDIPNPRARVMGGATRARGDG